MVVESRLTPLSVEPAAALRLGRRAVEGRRAIDGLESSSWLTAMEERLAAGAIPGRLYWVAGAPVGFASWSAGGPLGVSVDLLYVEPTERLGDEYARLLREVEASCGPIAFVHGPLPGLSTTDEERSLEPLGFRRYSRSEMVRRGSLSARPEPSVPGESLRPVVPADVPALAELHRRAYHDRFDRFLFLELDDEAADSRREVDEILGGRWGEFSATGSLVAEQDGAPVGAVLSVVTPAGVLVADVMVEPARQGSGVGRRMLTASLRALDRAGTPSVYLNVTEGNERALRLYRSLGFSRSLGPSRDWYHAGRIPVAPVSTG